uniref:Uncharacterized protein n=1 Tax=Oryza sativa subsp. japonica TaxID=39947 RepID=Q9AYL0_ORYSJ|nr:hypothetical protein [Oryza sativa Japonica Group]
MGVNGIVIETGPVIELVRLSVQWFAGSTGKEGVAAFWLQRKGSRRGSR